MSNQLSNVASAVRFGMNPTPLGAAGLGLGIASSMLGGKGGKQMRVYTGTPGQYQVNDKYINPSKYVVNGSNGLYDASPSMNFMAYRDNPNKALGVFNGDQTAISNYKNAMQQQEANHNKWALEWGGSGQKAKKNANGTYSIVNSGAPTGQDLNRIYNNERDVLGLSAYSSDKGYGGQLGVDQMMPNLQDMARSIAASLQQQYNSPNLVKKGGFLVADNTPKAAPQSYEQILAGLLKRYQPQKNAAQQTASASTQYQSPAAVYKSPNGTYQAPRNG